MDILTILLAITAISGVSLLIWSNTKSGKKWLASL